MSIQLLQSYMEAFNPFFQVEIVDQEARKKKGGRPLEALEQIPPEDIISFEFQDDDTDADMLKLTLRDPDLKKLDSINYKIDNMIRFTFGQLGGLIAKPRYMVIKAINPDFNAAGSPTIELVAFEQTIQLAQKFRSKNWGKLKSSQIVSQIAKLNDFESDVDDTDDLPKKDIMQSPSISDILFILELASRVNYIVYMEGNVLCYKKRPLDNPPKHIFYYRNYDESGIGTLISFKPKASVVKPSGVSQSDGKKKVKKTSETSKQNVLGAFRVISNISGEIRDESKPDAAGVKHTPAPGDEKRMQNEAQAQIDADNLKIFEGSASLIGNASVEAKNVIEIRGVGTKYSGKYYLKAVTHKISQSGYLMDFTVNREGLTKGDPKKEASKKKSGDKLKEAYRSYSNVSGKQTS